MYLFPATRSWHSFNARFGIDPQSIDLQTPIIPLMALRYYINPKLILTLICICHDDGLSVEEEKEKKKSNDKS